MKTRRKLMNWTLALTCVGALTVAQAQDAAPAAPASAVRSASGVDNTRINARDKGGAMLTPQNQSNSAQDRETLAAVRRAIVGDKSLSTMAHNVKILVEGGTVTLRGPVKNEDEKSKVESLAKNVKGITTTDNQLDVKTNVSAQ